MRRSESEPWRVLDTAPMVDQAGTPVPHANAARGARQAEADMLAQRNAAGPVDSPLHLDRVAVLDRRQR
jgi:hypothetical protein